MIPPLHPEEVKARLRVAHGTLLKFEKRRSLPFRSVSQVLAGKAILATAEAIADELDIPLHRVSSHYHDQFYKLSTSPRYRRNADRAHRINAGAK